MKIWLKIINEFSKVTGYKTNIQRSTVFPYTSNEQVKYEIKRPNLFTKSSKRIIN